MKFATTALEQIIMQFTTDIHRGLTPAEASERLKRDGPNKLPEAKSESLFWVFLRQFQNPLIYLLVIAAAIIFALGYRFDAFIISGVLMFNAVVGTVQEGRTRNILASLQHFIRANAVVVHNSTKHIVHDEVLVVGDIILLQEGERVPADARLIVANNTRVDEALLTGESVPVEKQVVELSGEVPIYAQRNMLFKGTYVLTGSARAIVVATGVRSAVGRLHRVVEGIKPEIPLKQEMDRLSYGVLIFILVVCTFLLGLGLLLGKTFTDLLVMLTALFICVIPEGLPVVLTLVLVTGAYRMARRQVLIKRLQAVDTLGRVQVVAIDKTGTLTRNEMMVSRVFADGQFCTVHGVGYYVEGSVEQATDTVRRMGVAAALLDNAVVHFEPSTRLFSIEGDPTEAALGIFAQKLNLSREQLETEYELLVELPFESRIKYHAALFKHQGTGVAFLIGSPESLARAAGGIDAPTQEALDRMLHDGLRVVAVASKQFDVSNPPADFANHEAVHAWLQQDLQFLGLCGIQDAIRPEVAGIVAQARDAGLRVIMITGDHQKTARYVAQHVGILREGDQLLDATDPHALVQALETEEFANITVFSRVTPENKLAIVKWYMARDYTVAMTGDGVNDVPSLVAADVGIAMGNIGTEVAKQAADVILLDDSFANIIDAIKEGRHIFYALRRVILYFFATNMGEVLVIFFALCLRMEIPILAVQILWLNLVTDGFLDVALAMEPREKGILKKRWLKRGAVLVDRRLLIKMFYMAVPMGIGSIIIFSRYAAHGLAKARTMTLVTMAIYQWFNAWNCRSETKSVFEIGFFSNKWLILATAFVGLLQVLVVRVPWMQTVFKTVPLTAHEFGVIIAITLPLWLIEEVRKAIVRRWDRNGGN